MSCLPKLRTLSHSQCAHSFSRLSYHVVLMIKQEFRLLKRKSPEYVATLNHHLAASIDTNCTNHWTLLMWPFQELSSSSHTKLNDATNLPNPENARGAQNVLLIIKATIPRKNLGSVLVNLVLYYESFFGSLWWNISIVYNRICTKHWVYFDRFFVAFLLQDKRFMHNFSQPFKANTSFKLTIIQGYI